MFVTKKITIRDLLRNFKEIRQSLAEGKVDQYEIPAENDVLILQSKEKKTHKYRPNSEEILRIVNDLPKDFKFTRVKDFNDELLPERDWNRKK